MSDSIKSNNLKDEFDVYLSKVFLNKLTYILLAGIVILTYYLYSDWNVRDSMGAVYTRIPSLILISVLLVIHLAYQSKFYKFKRVLYIVICIALQLMMYGKCLVHLHEPALAPSVTGTILVIFLISLDIKENTSVSSIIYFLPVVVFSALLFFVRQPSAKEFFVLADVYPIIFVGFAINRIQYRLRFRLFKSNHLLKLEQHKTKALFKETLQFNTELEKKAKEAIAIKEEIQQKNEELNKSNATKDRFLGIIAHDLKNPINTIWGLSDLLIVDRQIEEEEQFKIVETINKSVQHTHDLLEDLLSWARAQNKSIVFDPSMVRVNDIIEKELQVLNQMAMNKSIKIKNVIKDDLNIFVDSQMLEVIVRNLVSNAIKYSFLESSIIINAKEVVRNDQEGVEICIQDSGIGMDNDKLAKLFTISKDISTKGTLNEDGTGLGLLLCKEFIDLHKGIIEVESEPEKGSTFSCFFPLQVNLELN
ncbi:sensor histidine kinase [Carboxylicivirga linearis]|uniref:histidine kinase n=1 Tax=Carboxylicivirga linearis TaxID=1628157 RepID=A0ABS5JYN2_9BACT|nr:HAMP domain-containing sensor histidine kinase [Carboxylicivirga linearis]MBS2099949.1 HAMP domain-containing histidine kinase [Carboxylicivirga linearis]